MTAADDPDRTILGFGETACETMAGFSDTRDYRGYYERLAGLGTEQGTLLAQVILAAGAALCPEHAEALNQAFS